MNQKLAMGFDFGSHHIGIAIGQRLTATATPLAIIKAKNGIPDWQDIDALISDWQPEVIIVGLPTNMDDSPSLMTRRAEKFANRLTARYQIPHVLTDERLSTRAARDHSRAERIDDLSAALILETWLKQ
ncbi:MAG TPA: Holliday junction resolvase RuvX [Gammaproteobacteria bacterium]|nr:Holliday junction resolvase RuvX [Gammaproteobacteria bacterium]HIK70820.1 Holliday junction resolvase RuvX [Pseudomonadales bacterium]